MCWSNKKKVMYVEQKKIKKWYIMKKASEVQTPFRRIIYFAINLTFVV